MTSSGKALASAINRAVPRQNVKVNVFVPSLYFFSPLAILKIYKDGMGGKKNTSVEKDSRQQVSVVQGMES